MAKEKKHFIIEMERLYLREFKIGDGNHFYHLNKDPEVIQYTGNKPFRSLKEANDFIRDYNEYQRNGFGRWAVCLKSSNAFLGWCGLKFEPAFNEVDLGYRFYRKYWGKGYATEASKAAVKYGFKVLKLAEIVGKSHKKNRASIEILKKCNFKFEKEFNYEGNQAVKYRIQNDSD